MVHALREARRVLQPDGLLLELRSGPVHRRIGIEVAGQYQQLAVMGESLHDEHAANRAIAEVLNLGLFKLLARTQVNCNRIMSVKDFKVWLLDFAYDRATPPERLIQTVEQAYGSKGRGKKIVVKGPLVLKILKKMGT